MISLSFTDIEYRILRTALAKYTKQGVTTGIFDQGAKDALRGLILKMDNEDRVKRGEAPRSLHDIAKGVK